ncbi:hypothetical protein ACPWT1_21095 [Ramlibacter sp. MMS24-I3-19]|uniref:hypothetical protein n=1 Tax=Ramlibacter sp. MMS24-I3-19 TaxID=3416606 RepID=UPI003D07C8FA
MNPCTSLDTPALRAPTVLPGAGWRSMSRPAALRRLGAAIAVGCALALAGCGGGGDAGGLAVEQGTTLQVGVVAGGTTYAPAPTGQTLVVEARVGQPVTFDTNEPVVWSFSVNGSPLFSNGTTVDLGGVTITESQLDASGVVLDSAFYGPALVPIDVLLTATSVIDNAQVATIRLVLR